MRALAEEVQAAASGCGLPGAVRRPGDAAAALRRWLPRWAAEPAADPSGLPFRFDPALPAPAAGRALAALHRRMARAGPSLPALLAGAFDAAGLGPETPERRLAMLGAVLAHAAPAPRFHNARHTSEVVADAIWLAAAPSGSGAAGLVPADRALLLLAATVHDLGHDGGTNRRPDGAGRMRAIPCLLEDRALALILPAAAQAGLGAARRDDLVAVVRATDIALRLALAALCDGQRAGALPDPLARLAARPRARAVAALLVDADVLASAGLTGASLCAQTARLGAERGAKLAPAETLDFLDRMLGGRFVSEAGRRMEGNLRRLRDAVAGNVGVSGGGPS